MALTSLRRNRSFRESRPIKATLDVPLSERRHSDITLTPQGILRELSKRKIKNLSSQNGSSETVTRSNSLIRERHASPVRTTLVRNSSFNKERRGSNGSAKIERLSRDRSKTPLPYTSEGSQPQLENTKTRAFFTVDSVVKERRHSQGALALDVESINIFPERRHSDFQFSTKDIVKELAKRKALPINYDFVDNCYSTSGISITTNIVKSIVLSQDLAPTGDQSLSKGGLSETPLKRVTEMVVFTLLKVMIFALFLMLYDDYDE